MKAYKYRSFAEHHLKCLENDKIYTPAYAELNDPYEGFFNDQITYALKVLETAFNLNGKQVLKDLKSLIKYQFKVGVFSLSEIYDEELLWAHYSDSHKGFCIEYDVDKLKDKYLAPQKVIQFKVKYQEHPPIIDINDISVESLLTKLFATKLIKWEYEKEVRLIFDGGSSFKNYHPSAVTGIYFGAKMSSSNKQRLINLLENRDIKFYKMQLGKNAYCLKAVLVHENFKSLDKNARCLYEILKTNHFPANQNFDVLYKGTKFDEKTIMSFIGKFIAEHAIKDCNVFLFKKLGKKNIEFASYDTKTPGYIFWNDFNEVKNKLYD